MRRIGLNLSHTEHIMNLTRLNLAYFTTCFLGVFVLALMATLGCSHQDEPLQQMARPVKVTRIADQGNSVMSFAGEVRTL